MHIPYYAVCQYTAIKICLLFKICKFCCKRLASSQHNMCWLQGRNMVYFIHEINKHLILSKSFVITHTYSNTVCMSTSEFIYLKHIRVKPSTKDWQTFILYFDMASNADNNSSAWNVRYYKRKKKVLNSYYFRINTSNMFVTVMHKNRMLLLTSRTGHYPSNDFV